MFEGIYLLHVENLEVTRVSGCDSQAVDSGCRSYDGIDKKVRGLFPEQSGCFASYRRVERKDECVFLDQINPAIQVVRFGGMLLASEN